ncbi:hypothetical protein B7494_g6212 [Chlorociboria aeruginascens]|nr:hypothetical protein B7494_g6212 [Chlorociboria aeruginascens]
MSGDIEIDDHEVSDGASENEYSEHEHQPDAVGIEEDENTDMAELKFEPEDEDGRGAVTAKPKLDPKDPLRPRRKKARRACFACQRAHLTCGDERPCQRCIKRGLADACQDGVRKKAKYLHDASPDSLRPVLGPTFSQTSNNSSSNNSSNLSNNVTASASASETSPSIANFYSQADSSPSSYPIFSRNQQTQMPPPLQTRLPYAGSQQSPLSPSFQVPSSRQPTSMQGISVPQVSSNDAPNSFGGALFDPSNPALFNFDLEGLNFGNHYGALEFGMLGHMSSGVAETPPKDGGSMQQNVGDVNFNSGGVFGNNMNQFGQIYSPEVLPDFVGIDRQNSMGYGGNVHHGLPHAYAIATGPTSHHSPSTDASPQASTMGFESPNATTYTPSTTPHPSSSSSSRPPKRQDTKLASKFGPTSMLGKRSRDPSSIYDTVHEPYSYTTGFHSLTAFLQRRFSPNKTLRIAKSLASIRPSFISSTKNLNRQDLIFMEKCFQRTLFEYEDFMLSYCTPTLVCRRTGEIAAVNKEFTLLTGWTKNVLLGQEANLNINTGKSSAASDSGPTSLNNTGRAGLATPRMRPLTLAEAQGKEGRPQPVFFAELLDDDSVIQFYEDFAKLAFGDSRGSVVTNCKLLKYQTKEGAGTAGESKNGEGSLKRKEVGGSSGKPSIPGGIGGMGGRVREIDGEFGIGRLERDGKMDCTYCWTVKRDVFDIPMLIVMNFLPWI